MKHLFRIIISCLLFCMAFGINSCCVGGVKTSDNGPLPESALRFVPYLKDSIYSFQHINGLVVNFETNRETHEDWSHCADCCYEERFETNAISMIPDSPIFQIKIEISNSNRTDLNCYVLIGKYGFSVPTNLTYNSYFEKLDSLTIDSTSYYDVFKLGPPQQPYTNNDPIKMDSLFYNYEFGILKILMSNGEYYQILQ